MMKSIVDENLVSFKVLEQKALLGKRKALCRLNWKACGFIRRGNNSIQKSIPGCVYKIKKLRIRLEDCLCQGIVPAFSEFQCFMEKDLWSMGYKCVGMRCLYFRHPYRYVLI